MLKKIHPLVLLFLFMISAKGYAQTNEAARAISVYNHDSEADAREVIQKIVDVVGLKPNFEIRAGNVVSAAAIISKGKRYIIYNPEFMRKILSTGKTEWGEIGIIAHEVGHHLNGHTLTAGGSKPSTELEADEFVGFVLRKMGATLIEAKIGIAMISTDKGSKTHPPRSQRMASIENGWKQANSQLSIANKEVFLVGERQ